MTPEKAKNNRAWTFDYFDTSRCERLTFGSKLRWQSIS
jgi:hypothetical protein